MQQPLHHIPPPASGRDDKAHYDEHQIVVPPVAVLAPESCLPDEDLLLNCTEHDQDQTDGGELAQDSEGNPRPPASSATPRKRVNAGLAPMLAPRPTGSLACLQPLVTKMRPT